MNYAPQPPTPLDVVPNVIAGGVFLGALTFVIIYAAFANWRKTAPGRALMYWAISFDALVLMNTVHLATGRYPGIEFVRIVVYSALLFSVWRLVAALIGILRGGQPITLATFIDIRDNRKPKPCTEPRLTPELKD